VYPSIPDKGLWHHEVVYLPGIRRLPALSASLLRVTDFLSWQAALVREYLLPAAGVSRIVCRSMEGREIGFMGSCLLFVKLVFQ
jgi:hypothetical protein